MTNLIRRIAGKPARPSVKVALIRNPQTRALARMACSAVVRA